MGACGSPAMTTITVDPPTMPTLITPPPICETLLIPFDLSVLEDPSFPNGTWTGDGITGTQFDPAGQTSPLMFTFTPSDPCTEAATITVILEPAQMPSLGTVSACEVDGSIDLITLQDPAFPIGTWSGSPNISGTTLDLTGLSGSLTLTYTPTGLCLSLIHI